MSDIANAIYRHLRTMAPHQLERLTAIQLREAADEIKRLQSQLSDSRQHGETGQPVLTDAEWDDLRVWRTECLRQAITATEGGDEKLAERWLERSLRAAAMLERTGGGE